jgi:hypothetical protein
MMLIKVMIWTLMLKGIGEGGNLKAFGLTRGHRLPSKSTNYIATVFLIIYIVCIHLLFYPNISRFFSLYTLF